MNPTGTVYLNANANYVWTDGDVYLIPQMDTVEGDWPGASFGGEGDANQPHQLILDKLQQIHAKQIIDEQNLALLSAISFISSVGLNGAGLFTSGKDVNGWLKFQTNDSSAGLIYPIFQWGQVSLMPYSDPGDLHGNDPPNPLPFNFPEAFPNAVWEIVPYWITTGPVLEGLFQIGVEVVTPVQPQGNQFWFTEPGTSNAAIIADALGDIVLGSVKTPSAGFIAIGWVALGY